MNILIIGGAGFIGVNTARHFLKQGQRVVILDDFSRKGTRLNIEWLLKDFADTFRVVEADIVKDNELLIEEVSKVDVVIHLAAQVAVTTSITDPRRDFEINALGTFNILEAIRLSANKPFLIFSSTNKVYGSLPHRDVSEEASRYVFKDEDIKMYGIGEHEPLDFHSPYGCSKGAADQYVIDYSRIYDMKTVVFRQSCIYGEYQFGVEDQGWVAWFAIATLLEKPLSLYGNGKQVRDILFVTDLVRLYELAIENQALVSGESYNVGGGPQNTLSLLELLQELKEWNGKEVTYSSEAIRAGDQPVFIADIRKAEKDLGWKPVVNVEEGLQKMLGWIKDNKEVFTTL